MIDNFTSGQFMVECTYCGKFEKRFMWSIKGKTCNACGSEIKPENVYSLDKFDVYGYNYVPPKKEDNSLEKDIYGYDDEKKMPDISSDTTRDEEPDNNKASPDKCTIKTFID